MESQILYESLTKPRCDLDKNMNKTSTDDLGKYANTVHSDISTVEKNASGQDEKETNHEIQRARVPNVNDSACIKDGLKSKLLKQLQSPLAKVDDTQCLSLPKDRESELCNDISEDVDRTICTEGFNSQQSANNGTNEPINTIPPFVQDSNLVVSTNEITSDTSSLASPVPSLSSSRSMSASPLPSPATSHASGHEVSSSRSVTNGIKKQKRRRRGSAWTDVETEYLMEVWAKQAEIIQQKGGDESATCAPVYRLISRSMAELGWDKTWEQCKTRIHTLKRAYKITKDEISEGSLTVTYCRHFDLLEIISGDNPQISPGMLALTLEHKRKDRLLEGKNKKHAVRRKLTVAENPKFVKKVNVGNSLLGFPGFSPLQGQNVVSSTQNIQNTTSANTTWSPPGAQQQQQIQLQQSPPQFQLQQQQPLITLTETQPSVKQPLPASVLPQVQPYHVTSTSGNDVTQLPAYRNAASLDTKISIKSELMDTQNTNTEITVKRNEHTGALWNVLSSQQTSYKAVTPPRPSPGNDLERMRLDLEMRKLEVERNKIDMEERQRREDRNHQYRMMQLLLFGLGQQNISQVGTDVAHAHDAVLSRALENGLVPGGSQTVNEKGLSFSEL